MNRICTVTGGGGFIGAHLVRRLVHDGWEVSVIDNMIRGDKARFADVAEQVKLHTCDIRDAGAVGNAIKGSQVVFHLAAVNGTENFYTRPELVLDVGLRGALAVVEACRAVNVLDLVVASSAEVYQTPSRVPTSENTALMLPDSLNPRYSYGGSKIVSELIAFNYARDHFRKVQVFRPHNVYGPDMGWKHVLPQFVLRALACKETGNAEFPIQGDGSETRAFACVDDVVSGIICMYLNGGHRQIYHIGNDAEISMADLAGLVGKTLGVDLDIHKGPAPAGGTPRRCPDISKMRSIGYDPQTSLTAGVARLTDWYVANKDKQPANSLM